VPADTGNGDIDDIDDKDLKDWLRKAGYNGEDLDTKYNMFVKKREVPIQMHDGEGTEEYMPISLMTLVDMAKGAPSAEFTAELKRQLPDLDDTACKDIATKAFDDAMSGKLSEDEIR
jgi:hypothetical protein